MLTTDEKPAVAPRRPKTRRKAVRTDWRPAVNFALMLGNLYVWYGNVEPWILIGSLVFVFAVVAALEAQRSSVLQCVLIALLAIGFFL